MHSNAGAPSSHTPPSHQRSVVQTTRGLEAVTEAGKRASSCINDAAPVRPMQCGMVRALAHFVTSRSGETLCLSVPPPVLILANYCATTWYSLIKTSNTSVRQTCDLEEPQATEVRCQHWERNLAKWVILSECHRTWVHGWRQWRKVWESHILFSHRYYNTPTSTLHGALLCSRPFYILFLFRLSQQPPEAGRGGRWPEIKRRAFHRVSKPREDVLESRLLPLPLQVLLLSHNSS